MIYSHDLLYFPIENKIDHVNMYSLNKLFIYMIYFIFQLKTCFYLKTYYNGSIKIEHI